jgi:hypothetical protein
LGWQFDQPSAAMRSAVAANKGRPVFWWTCQAWEGLGGRIVVEEDRLIAPCLVEVRNDTLILTQLVTRKVDLQVAFWSEGPLEPPGESVLVKARFGQMGGRDLDY